MKLLCTFVTAVLIASPAADAQDTATALPDFALQPARVITDIGPDQVYQKHLGAIGG